MRKMIFFGDCSGDWPSRASSRPPGDGHPVRADVLLLVAIAQAQALFDNRLQKARHSCGNRERGL